jgi:hypothetical protein
VPSPVEPERRRGVGFERRIDAVVANRPPIAAGCAPVPPDESTLNAERVIALCRATDAAGSGQAAALGRE